MIRKRRVFPWPVVAALAALFLTFIVSSASAVSKVASRTADRPGNYNTGGFTFGSTQKLVRPSNPVFFDQNAEPEIKSDIFGNIYATAINGVPGGTDLWKSTDNGGTFSYLGQPDGAQDHCTSIPLCLAAGGGDDSIDVSNGGYLYVSSLWLGSVTMSASYDGGTGGAVPGQKWEVNPAAATIPGDDRQWIAHYGPQTVYMSYTDIPTGAIEFEKSVDAGKTFSAPAQIYNPVTSAISSELQGNIAVDQYNGNIYAVFIPVASGGHSHREIWIARSTDGGATWSLHQAYQGPAGTDNGQVFPSMAVDRGGNIHIVFSRCNVGGTPAHQNCQIWLVSSPLEGTNGVNTGNTWLDAVRVSNGAATASAVEPTVAAGSDGHVDVTWLGSSVSSPDIAGNWFVFFAQTPDAMSGSPTFNQVQAVAQTVHDNVICFNGLACASGTRDLLEYYSMTLDPDGNANIAFTDTVNNCDSSTCISGAWYTKQVAGASAYAPPAGPAASTFATNYPVGSPGAEPSIWVDTDNQMYVTAPGNPWVWKSTNTGASFGSPVNPVADETTLTGGDEDIITIPKPSGNPPDDVYFADLGISSVHIRKSTDGGASWLKPGTGGSAGDVSVSSDRQWLGADCNGASRTVYEWDHELASEVMRLSSLVNDTAWLTTSGMTDPELSTTVPNTNPGPIFVDKSTHKVYALFNASVPTTNAQNPPFGKLLNVWETDADPPATPATPATGVMNHPVFKGVYDSATNPPPATGPPVGPTYGTNNANIFPAGDIDAGGNIYVAWSMNNSRTNEFSIWFAASHDHGKTYYGPFFVSSGPLAADETAVFPWVAAGANGKVDIVYYKTTTVSDPNTMPLSAPWNVFFAQSLNANSREPVFTVSQVSDHVMHLGEISTGGLIGSADRSLLDFFEISIGPDGVANIIYADNGATATHAEFARQASGPSAGAAPAAACGPTAVRLSSFSALRARGHRVQLHWTTGSEVGVAGFNIWRSIGKLPYRKLNAKLIPSKGTFGRGGHRYEYVDRGARARGAYFYKLELVQLDGKRQWAGSIRTTARASR